jgi:transcriptional regulator with XRE-family HTH domain
VAADPYIVLGRRIRDLRLERGLSQTSLAELAEVHYSHISLLERGLTNPTLSSLMRLAAALDTTAADLVKGLKWSSGSGTRRSRRR